MKILGRLLADCFGPYGKRRTAPAYEVVGDDGTVRRVQRSGHNGRKYSAQVAPGVTAHWDSLRQARAEGYTIRPVKGAGR